jgi:serine/threonine protein kinase
MRMELELLSKIHHPNIIKVAGAGSYPRKFIEVEYLAGGTLHDLLKSRGGDLEVGKALSMARNVAFALKYLHEDFHPEATIIHRDLKPQNIGFTADGQLKLFDFGLVSCVQRRSCSSQAYAMTGFTGTMAYMAPEVALRQPYNEAVDVYSFGILLWQLLSGGETPFAGMSREDYVEQVAKGGLRPATDALAGRGVPSSAVELMERCWNRDPTQRPSCTTIWRLLGQAMRKILGHSFSYSGGLELGEVIPWVTRSRTKCNECSNQVDDSKEINKRLIGISLFASGPQLASLLKRSSSVKPMGLINNSNRRRRMKLFF